MQTELAKELGIEIPLFAFTRSPQVVVEVSKAGGMGVLGVIATGDDALRESLDYIEAHIGGRPYGVDVVMPAGYVSAGKGQGMGQAAELEKMLPESHRLFVNSLLDRFDVPPLPEGSTQHEALKTWTDGVSRKQVDIALEYPIKLLANALGPPPPDVITKAHAQGVKVAALVGSVKHALRQAAAGVDIIVAQGTEAGGHCGEVSTFVLVPDIVDALPDVHVLAAGGIGSGRQLAAALALGAQGAWTGSLWLTAAESHTSEAVRNKLLAAGSSDTVRSRAISGKPARQLVTEWSKAWDAEDSPQPLPMPLQFMLTAEAVGRIHRHAQSTGETALLAQPVGQIVGRMNAIRPTADIVAGMVDEFHQTRRRLSDL